MAQFQTRMLAFRIRDERDYNTIMEKILASGLTHQQYLLSAALDQTITNTDGLKALIPEIKRIGNNINQISKRANENRSITEFEIEEVKKELNSIWQLLKSQIHTAV